MNFINNGWFTELSPDSHPHQMSFDKPSFENDKSSPNKPSSLEIDQREENKGWQGQAFSLKVSEILYHEKSSYQDILVFKR